MIKKLLISAILAMSATAANADFFGGNDGEWKRGPNGPYRDESDWPVWTPMYWMEEFFDSWDDEDEGYGYGGPSGGYGYQPMMGYPQMTMPRGNYAAPAPLQ